MFLGSLVNRPQVQQVLNTMGTKRKHLSADDDWMQANSLKKGDVGSWTSENGNELQTHHDQHELELVMELLKSFKSYPMGTRTLKVRR